MSATSDPATRGPAFRERFLAREPLLGTFIKTPTSHATEITGDVGFDYVVIDAEHAPFDRGDIDLVVLAARAAGIASIVRVPSADPSHILSALDCGATGVLVPHVSSQAKAREVAAACRHRGGRRGFSNSPRAGRYGALSTWEHIDACDAATTVIAMIEDPEALDEVDAIAAVEGIDGLFVGRGDLTAAYQAESWDAPQVRSALERTAHAARASGKTLCALIGKGDTEWLRCAGVTAFIVSSDQGLLRQAASQALADFRRIVHPSQGSKT